LAKENSSLLIDANESKSLDRIINKNDIEKKQLRFRRTIKEKYLEFKDKLFNKQASASAIVNNVTVNDNQKYLNVKRDYFYSK
jgi:hypothetical protein